MTIAMIPMPIAARVAPTLAVEGLSIDYGPVQAVRNVSLAIAPGEAYGLIGESGSGKSTVAYAVMGYLNSGRVSGGRVVLNGADVFAMGERGLEAVRGPVVSMVFQDPMNALNPSIRVGEQIAEGIRRHAGLDRRAARKRTLELIGLVNLPDPEAITLRYPHQLSGGQLQRIVIAMALALEPKLLVLDEPTTGLDVTTEAVILDLIADIKARSNVALLFISHNLGVVARMCDRVGVLYAGTLVEEGRTDDLLQRPHHPYTRGLIDAMPSVTAAREMVGIPGRLPDLAQVPEGCIFQDRCVLATADCRHGVIPMEHVGQSHSSRCLRWRSCATELAPARPAVPRASLAGVAPRLEVADLTRDFPGAPRLPFFRSSPVVQALRGVSLDVREGETVAIVGESGSGKSTFGRLVAGLDRPGGGRILFDGRDISALARARGRDDQRDVQFVFQNPHSALNPHHSVEAIIGRPLRLYLGLRGRALRERVLEILTAVRLGERYLTRAPRELSGGEKQRVCIARAFAANPKLVICDEPTSALDISVQAAILQELRRLQRESENQTSYLFITHDLGVVRQIADRVAVMYLGEIVEFGETADIFTAPQHPYTEALLAAVPEIGRAEQANRRDMRLEGPLPKPTNPPTGCGFHTRCPRVLGPLCETMPPKQSKAEGHWLKCHIPIAQLRRLQESG
ncbi:dipeptide ABC transporter ATP-binding protein [Chelatococcus asaccharovorans]|uniref:dipeptide ABC transporter ATP-binding protein n=1 Tax=Chelatococcus asaccharovorans TaxID=28210 RepID=UPI00224C71AD|nr:ABC transporter ATP-binding protein [Chelatococcus asaccharovorans]CAH1650866.1 Peptide/nickel transport system ATP-binding protein [Chelatococcus asaccharovorans]CAH1692595.1 Peptide/nickel transport system ATP-binding protein [Chelatococcus asaccharovorans]